MKSQFLNKLIGLQRYTLWHQALGTRNYYVSEFPKSGGTWFCQMLSSLTEIPFPRNKFVTEMPCILHSHLLPHDKLKNPIIVLRDGRDVMVSAYHHFIIPNDHCPSHEQKKWASMLQSSLDLYDVSGNLYKFIEIFHQNYTVGGKSTTWQNHVLTCQDLQLLSISYESLLSHPTQELARVKEYLDLDINSELIEQVIEKFSFKSMKIRNPNSTFLRKGTSGDWKNYFTFDTGELFESLGGEALRLHNYTVDNTWYHELPK